MSSTTPLTDAINALTTYANEVTGKSDTTLSDAVESLVDGYGGGSSFDANAWVDGSFTPKKIVFDADLNRKAYIFSHCPFEEIVWTYKSTRNIDISSRMFLESQYLKTFVATSFSGAFGSASTNAFDGCISLEKVDWSGNGLNGAMFVKCSSLTTVILRRSSSIVSVASNSFNNTPFASGGTGGTLYVPQSLISSYQSANNWSTILGYENNSIVAIEGSQYETQYADGTPISTT